MSVLKCFFEIGRDPALFEGLKIAQEKELCEKYMGKFPVISISLKSVDGRNFESASVALRTLIGNEARRFDFLRNSANLSNDDKNIYAQLTEARYEQGGFYAMTEGMTAASLQTLSQLLEKHYGQKVILLIDEYDVPLDKAFQAGYYDEMISLIRNFLGNALKTNDSLYFAVLTGCLRISKESIFTGLNNLKVHTLSDVRYDECFGFTNADVDDLLADSGAEPENYWANTSGNDLTCRKRVPGKKMELALPNWEVREQFIDLVKDWFEEMTQADSTRISRFCAAFPAGDTDTIQEMLGDYLWDSISVRDTAVRRNLEAACREALKQIEEKRYAEGLKRRGMKKIIKYGIAFWKKECMVAMV